MTTSPPVPTTLATDDDDAPPVAAPISRPQRSLAPDLARGMLLLFIAVANVWGYLYGRDTGIGYRPVDGGAADQVVAGLVAFLVAARSRPRFAILYGFGIAMMMARMAARGVDDGGIRRVLRRRSLMLIGLGVLHAGLLFSGDILAPYGVTGLIALVIVHRRRAVLLRWFWVSLVLSTAALVATEVLAAEVDADTAEQTTTYLGTMVDGLISSGVAIIGSAVFLLFVPPVVIGVLLHRAGWLQWPWDHRAALGRVFVWTAVANVVVNLPWALAVARVWEPSDGMVLVLGIGHELSGLAMGLGYICLFGWVAAVLRDRRRGLLLTGITAVGERSLTCYLLQSVAFAPLLSVWGLGWGARLGTAAATVLAVGVWSATVALALWMHRNGRRGPMEVLLRRVAYRGAAPSSPTPAPGVAHG